MIDEQQAKEIAVEYLDRLDGSEKVAILDEHTRRGDWGWCFVYESERYLQTGDFRDQLVGNGPIIVSKNGKIYRGGTGETVEYYIDEFRRGNLEPVE